MKIKGFTFHQGFLENGTVTEVLLYGLIEALSYEKGFCYASNDYLASELKLSPYTISHALSSLYKKGWIQIQLNDKKQREAIIPQLQVGCSQEQGGVAARSKGGLLLEATDIKKKDNIVDNINNKDKSLLFIGEALNGEVVEKPVEKPKTYGNEQVNEAFAMWEEIIGLKQKNSAANRRAAYNLVRSKGFDWIRNSLKILVVAQGTDFVEKRVKGISNYNDLQNNWEYLWNWGKGRAQTRANSCVTDKI